MLVELREACVLCDHEFDMEPVLMLPDTPCANEFVSEPRYQKNFPLNLHLCRDCGHLQLEAVVDPAFLFSNYVYTSGISAAFVKHFSTYAESLITQYALDANSMVVEIGSNDGTLLREFKKRGVRVHGVEPAKVIAANANLTGIPTTNAFFDEEVANELRRTTGPVTLITANNVWAHIGDLQAATLAVQSLLAPDGIFIFEVSYLLDVVQKLLFDTIYHEHLSYHAVRPLQRFFNRHNMTLFDVERVPTHGGSIRCHVSRQPRPVSNRVRRLIDLEIASGLFSPYTYQIFSQAIDERRQLLTRQLAKVHARGGRLCGYGASAKLTTLMYTFRLDGADFDFVVDDSSYKMGLYTPGKHIRIAGRDELQKVSGHNWACLVFAWNFFESIVKLNADWDGEWINPNEK